jgi:hypothetical protein
MSRWVYATIIFCLFGFAFHSMWTRRGERNLSSAIAVKPHPSIDDLMQIIEHAKDYPDLIDKITNRYQPDTFGTFFALHADRTVLPTRPQVFFTSGPMQLAYAPQMYAEILYSLGEETIHFQLVERPEGGISINAFTFANTGKMAPASQYELTPAQVRAMSSPQLIEASNHYAQVGCLRCHLSIRRRLVELDNHGRQFRADPAWQFRNPDDQSLVQRHLTGIFNQFAQSDAVTHPLYRWMWNQPQVVARGGRILPDDTFKYQEFVKTMVTATGQEMLGELKRSSDWRIYRESFAAAVGLAPRIVEIHQESGGFIC